MKPHQLIHLHPVRRGGSLGLGSVDRGAKAGQLKALDAAARKRELDQRKLLASVTRRKAAAARREKISAAFKSEQAKH